MKTIASTEVIPPSALNPGVIVLGILFAGVVFIALSGMKVPLLSNPKVAIIAVIVLGMAMCTQGGIGRVAAWGVWTHPLSIVGYVLGGLILVVAAAGLFGWKLPLVQTEQQALIAVAVLATVKVANAVLHDWLARM